MRTSKPISTISYNSPEFLTLKLNEWMKKGLVAYWCFIGHKGETLDDGTVEKDHIHVFIEPNITVDTLALQYDSQEVDAKHPDKPFKCIHFQPSKYDEWTWYVLHDANYLAMHFEQRQYEYTKDDFHFSDSDEFEDRYQRAMHSSEVVKKLKVHTAYANGYRASDLAFQGLLMPQQAVQYMAFDKLFNEGEKRKIEELKRQEELNSPLANEEGQTVLFPINPVNSENKQS